MRTVEKIRQLKERIDERLSGNTLIGIDKISYLSWQAALEWVLQGDVNDDIE